jgi:hypothetical protein
MSAPSVDALVLKRGISVQHQSTDIQRALLDMPDSAQHRVDEMLKDVNNEVSIDLDPSMGSATIFCKNGLSLSKVNVTWLPNEWLRHDTYSFVPEVRANPEMGLRSVSSASNPPPRPVQSTGEVPSSPVNYDAVRANPSLGLHSTAASTGRLMSGGDAIAANEVMAAPGQPLRSQPKEFNAAMQVIPSGLHGEIEKLLVDFDNKVSIIADVHNESAQIICRNGSRKSIMNASWSTKSKSVTPSPSRATPVTAVGAPSPKDSAREIPSAVRMVPVSTASETPVATNEIPAVAGQPLRAQSRAFASIVQILPPNALSEIERLLSDANNKVSIAADENDGSVKVLCRNGGRLTTLDMDSYTPLPPPRPAQASTSASISAAAANIQAAHPSLGLKSVANPYTHEVTATTPGQPINVQSTEFRQAAETTPKALQERIGELLRDVNNTVSLHINTQEGTAKVITKNGLKTSTLNATWAPELMAPGGPKPVTTTRTVPLTSKPSVSTGSVGGLSSAGTYVPKISSHSPAGGGGTLEATTGERANPSLGLRPLR